jgi:hypothetical protein
MNKKLDRKPDRKTSTKAAKLLRDIDDKRLENVSGGACRTCGLIAVEG